MKILSVSAGFVLLSGAAFAEIVKENAPLCISKRSVEAYQVNSQHDLTRQLNEDLIDRAACIIKTAPEEVILLERSGGYGVVQLSSGHKMWVDLNFIESLEPSVDEVTEVDVVEPSSLMKVETVSQETVQNEMGVGDSGTVAKKSTWLDKVKAYIPFQ